MSASASDDGQDFVNQAEGLGVTGAFKLLFTAPTIAMAAGFAGLVAHAFDAVARFRNVINSVWTFLMSLIESPIPILQEGAAITAAELADFGIMAFAVAVGVVGVGFLVWETIMGDRLPVVDAIIPWR